MPYITTERVAEIRNEIKTTFPQYRFSVKRDRTSTIDVSIMSGPLDFTEDKGVNIYYIDSHYEGEKKAFLLKLYEIVNKGNRIISDDGDYGSIPAFYVDIHIGQWNKPFVFIEAKEVEEVENGDDEAVLLAISGTTGAEIRHNASKDGIEIKFAKKPEQSVIDQFHESRIFRWSRFNKVWWSKVNDRAIEFAKKFGELPASLQVN